MCDKERTRRGRAENKKENELETEERRRRREGGKTTKHREEEEEAEVWKFEGLMFEFKVVYVPLLCTLSATFKYFAADPSCSAFMWTLYLQQTLNPTTSTSLNTQKVLPDLGIWHSTNIAGLWVWPYM